MSENKLNELLRLTDSIDEEMSNEMIRLQTDKLLNMRMNRLEDSVVNALNKLSRRQDEYELQNSNTIMNIKEEVGKIEDLSIDNGHNIADIKEGIESIEEILNQQSNTFFRAHEKVNKISKETELAKEIAISSNRIKNTHQNYINQRDFGNNYGVPISSVRIGRLFKVVGLAMTSKNKTEHTIS